MMNCALVQMSKKLIGKMARQKITNIDRKIK